VFKWVALLVVTLAIIVAGGLIALSNRQAHTQTTTDVRTATVVPAQPSSIFGPDETAFIRVCMVSSGTAHNQQICDCVYRSLRRQGVPASTLAVSSNDLISEYGSRIGAADADCD
jgi:hypothetical protein